nr:uncharacterized protein LOC111418777 [Onthophagus taurus]
MEQYTSFCITGCKIPLTKWNSLPELNITCKDTTPKPESIENNEKITNLIKPEDDDEEEEGLQEVAGKLEIRVVSKETKQRPQTLTPEKPPICGPVIPPKLERTRSILKQASKESHEVPQSPKRENICFAPEPELVKHLDSYNKDYEESSNKNEPQKINSNNGGNNNKNESESSGTETNEKKKQLERRKSQDSPRRLSIVKSDSNSHLDFEPVEALRRSSSAKLIPKSIERVKINASDNSSSTSQEKEVTTTTSKKIERRCVVNPPIKALIGEEMRKVTCSPGIDLSRNPQVTFVQHHPSSGGDQKRSVANGLSPGVEEQSEYFDATENPLIKDKKPEVDDEDSGVDNASQILRETSVSPGLDGNRGVSRIPVAVSGGGQRLAKCLRNVRGVPTCLIGASESSPDTSEGVPAPPEGEPTQESSVRCRRYRPVT